MDAKWSAVMAQSMANALHRLVTTMIDQREAGQRQQHRDDRQHQARTALPGRVRQ